MEFDDLIELLKKYKSGDISPKDDITEEDPRKFENKYISMRDYNISNVKQGGPKQWNIIYFPKKSYSHLLTFKQLSGCKDIRIAITPFKPVKRKWLDGCAALRVYDMVSDCDAKIVNQILKFIFGDESD